MSSCENNVPVPRGQICPTCGEQHSQTKARIGSGLIAFGLLAVLVGIGYFVWINRDDGYGYGY